jgi:hypothetical protein
LQADLVRTSVSRAAALSGCSRLGRQILLH